MTKRECAIVMAFTGTCMLTEDNLRYYYQYLEEIMDRPVYTHEWLALESEIKERSREDFISLCKNAK